METLWLALLLAPTTMRTLVSAIALVALAAPVAQAQMEHHQHHLMAEPVAAPAVAPADHSAHSHDLGSAGSTYDLRWIDAMVQHHTGALRMSEFVFDIGVPGVGALAKTIWNDQTQEIKAMGQWRKAWYPQAPLYPVVLKPGGDPNAMADLIPMSSDQMAAMRMAGSAPTPQTRVTWFLEGMLQHHGGALIMAHDALNQSSNPTILRLARSIIVAQRSEIIQIRKMLQHDGFNKPEYYQYDQLFSWS